MHEYTTTHWAALFPEHPSQNYVCLELGYAVLTMTGPIDMEQENLQESDELFNVQCWHAVILSESESEEFKQVISILSAPAVIALLVEHYPGLVPFVHDPLLIACYCQYWNVMEYMIKTEPGDVQRFRESMRACRNDGALELCITCLMMRPDWNHIRYEPGSEGDLTCVYIVSVTLMY